MNGKSLFLAMSLLLLSCKKEAETIDSTDIDISVVSGDGIISYRIGPDNSAIMLHEKFHNIDEINEFSFTTAEMDSIRQSIKVLDALQYPEIHQGIASDNYLLIIKTHGVDFKRHSNLAQGSKTINGFVHFLQKTYKSSKTRSVFQSRKGLVYPPPSPPPSPDMIIEKIKFVERPSAK